jgi:hypothetical protein
LQTNELTSSVVSCVSVEGWQFSSALQGRLRRDGAIVDSWQEFSCGMFA